MFPEFTALGIWVCSCAEADQVGHPPVCEHADMSTPGSDVFKCGISVIMYVTNMLGCEPEPRGGDLSLNPAVSASALFVSINAGVRM